MVTVEEGQQRLDNLRADGESNMNLESLFRGLFGLSGVAMLCVRVYYQRRARQGSGAVTIQEKGWSLAAGSLAALTMLVFGAEYVFFPGAFGWAYVKYPEGLRWLGAFALVAGITLLGVSHHHLGKSFHSLVVTKEKQVFVDSGPYRWIRHPIYTAFIINYVGGGLLAGSWVLTLIPALLYGVLVALRIKNEERAMIEQFGQVYVEYMQRTRYRLLPGVW
jgi:protein-S-isoprenylcysteine O-methyltransferase Ste14